MMFVPLFTRGGSNKFLALALFIATLLLLSHQALATSCQVYQVYPSEYAYKENSVGEHENNSANCRLYPSGLQAGVFTEEYTHCDGTQLKLTDSDLGQEQYQISDYYVWLAGSAAQLLFIFPTRVSLTTITLHYYSDGVHGLPRLRFFAVPDDFNVWNSSSTNHPQVDVVSVQPGGEPAGHRSISINVNFNAKKLLMHKRIATFQFAVSEVEFFICTTSTTMVAISTSSVSTTNIIVTTTGSLDFTEATLGTTVSSSGSPRSREIVAWVLVVMMQAII